MVTCFVCVFIYSFLQVQRQWASSNGAVVEWQWKPLATTLHIGGSGVMTVLLLNWSNSTVCVLPERQRIPIQG